MKKLYVFILIVFFSCNKEEFESYNDELLQSNELVGKLIKPNNDKLPLF